MNDGINNTLNPGDTALYGAHGGAGGYGFSYEYEPFSSHGRYGEYYGPGYYGGNTGGGVGSGYNDDEAIGGWFYGAAGGGADKDNFDYPGYGYQGCACIKLYFN